MFFIINIALYTVNKVSTTALRTINKNGITAVLKKAKANGVTL